MTVSIVIPAHNEASGLANLLPRLVAMVGITEIIVVDDGSVDETAQVASSVGVRVVSHPYCKGNGAAIKTGAQVAQGEILVFMDADGQHDPSDIPRLLESLDSGYDMVVGARSRGSQASLGRGIANRLYNRLAGYMTGHSVADLTSGLRAVRADRFREFLPLLPNGFSYPTTITMAFFRAGYSVSYLPINTGRRSGQSHIRPVQDGVRFLIIIFKIGTLYSPLKLFAPISLVFFLIGLSYYLYTFSTMGRFTNMSALLITFSFIVFLMGLISEQITVLLYKDNRK